LRLLFVFSVRCVFQNITLISMYFKFSRHVTGPFAVRSLAGRLAGRPRQQTISKMNIGNNLCTIAMCMHGVFLHPNRVGTVHTPYSGPFNFLQGANAADVILGIKTYHGKRL
jgi:hypothetical protein